MSWLYSRDNPGVDYFIPGDDWTDWRKNHQMMMAVGPAPSGRATCKWNQCKNLIEKGLLRVQLDEGDDDHCGSSRGAFHLGCFVESQNKYSSGGLWTHMGQKWGQVTKPEIQLVGFDKLTKAQQKEVIEAFSGSKKGSTTASASSATGGGYEVGYAFASQTLAKCRAAGCGQSIAPGALRIGEPYTGPKGEAWKSWKHDKCFFDAQQEELKASGDGTLKTKGKVPLLNVGQLGSSFHKLKGTDQVAIQALVNASLALTPATASPTAPASPAPAAKAKAKAGAKPKPKKKAAPKKRKRFGATSDDSENDNSEDDGYSTTDEIERQERHDAGDFSDDEADNPDEEYVQPKKKRKAAPAKKATTKKK